MKRFFTVMAAVLLMTMMAFSACAESAQFSSTQAFIDKLNEQQVDYTFLGTDNDGDECVAIRCEGETDVSFDIYAFFASDDRCYLCCWEVIEYSDSDFDEVLRVCNDLNMGVLTFYADESDSTVNASFYLGKYGEHVYSDFVAFAEELDEAYLQLEPMDNFYMLSWTEHMLIMMNRRGRVAYDVADYIEYEGVRYAVMLPKGDSSGVYILQSYLTENGDIRWGYAEDYDAMKAVYGLYLEKTESESAAEAE